MFRLPALIASGAMLVSFSANAADVAHGKSIFAHTCANCHSVEVGVNKVGPTLFEILDRPTASLPDYNYSASLRQLGATQPKWNVAAIDAWLTNPRATVHGVKMFFKGLPQASDRADVIAYLNTLK
jgi:cytochrome c